MTQLDVNTTQKFWCRWLTNTSLQAPVTLCLSSIINTQIIYLWTVSINFIVSVTCLQQQHCCCKKCMMKCSRCCNWFHVHVVQLVSCWRCHNWFHVHVVATGSMYTLWQLVPCSRCGNWFHVDVVATGFMFTLWQLVSCSLCGNWFHVHVIATGSMFTLWQLVPCSCGGNWFHVHIVVTGFSTQLHHHHNGEGSSTLLIQTLPNLVLKPVFGNWFHARCVSLTSSISSRVKVSFCGVYKK